MKHEIGEQVIVSTPETGKVECTVTGYRLGKRGGRLYQVKLHTPVNGITMLLDLYQSYIKPLK